MKPRLESNAKGCEGKITKPTSGNTAGRAEGWCSIFGWAGNGKVPNGSWATSRAYSRVTAMRHTTTWAAQRSYMQLVGRMPDVNSSKRWNSIQRTSELPVL